MALTLTAFNEPKGTDNTQKRLILEGTGVLTGSYTAGGETVNWNTIKDASGQAVLLNSLSATPTWAELDMTAPNTGGILIPVTYNPATNKFQIWVTTTGNELAAGAYGANYTGASFHFSAEFVAE
jgi:hypothetical protein